MSDCYATEIDGLPVRIQGVHPRSPEAAAAIAELVRAARTCMDDQLHAARILLGLDDTGEGWFV